MSKSQTEAHMDAYKEDIQSKPAHHDLVSDHEAAQSHHDNFDSKDQRSIASKLAAVRSDEKEDELAQQHKLRPTEIAASHGNEPSRGAKIDEQIENEERAELERKGKA